MELLASVLSPGRVCELSHCSPVRLFVTPKVSFAHGILQARITEWIAMPPPGDLPNPRIGPHLLRLLH